mgnify:CR=1 FL=1
MKKLIIIFSLLFVNSSFAAPDEFMTKLMDSKVDRLTFGLYHCDKALESTSNDVTFSICFYDFDDNIIELRIGFRDEINAKSCEEYIKLLKTNTSVRDNGDTYFIQYFTPSGFSDSLSKETYEKLGKYIKFKVGYYSSNSLTYVCESFANNLKPVLFY